MLIYQCDAKQAAAAERRRKFEEERRERIFNTRWRLIGVDKDFLDKQVLERRLKADEEQRLNDVYDQQLIQNDRLASRLEQELEKGRRDRNKELNEYRLLFQTPQSRREFDLYDPDLLKKSQPIRPDIDDLSPSSAQKFEGEDLAGNIREKLQKQQTRAWLEQQMLEKRLLDDEKKNTEKAFNDSLVALDKKACQIERLEDECKRSLNATILKYNKSLAQERSLEHEWEKRRDEVDKETEINNSLVGDLLCESNCVHMSNLGPNHVLGSMYKGMSEEERAEVRREQLRQIEEKTRQRRIDAEYEKQWFLLTESIAHKMSMREKTLCETKRDINESISKTNQQLALEQKARQIFLDKHVYVDQPTEEYYEQFNKDTR